MAKCLLCGKEIYLSFQCQYCEGNFCLEHRLPENHKCKNMWKAKASDKQKKPSAPPVTSPVGEEDESSSL